jgi:hypothetical protein
MGDVADTEFAHPIELALVFDQHGIAWEYEPHTFVLEGKPNGTVKEAFTPDFHLPELGLYVGCTVMRQGHTKRKRRKVERARERLNVPVEIMFRRDFEQLAGRWSLPGLARAAACAREV